MDRLPAYAHWGRGFRPRPVGISVLSVPGVVLWFFPFSSGLGGWGGAEEVKLAEGRRPRRTEAAVRSG